MSLAFERLEDRLLLAATAVQNGTTLTITFTGVDTDVALDGSAEGVIDVTGTDVDDDTYTGIKHIKIVGTDDDNSIDLIDIDITGNVSADMKGGIDDIDMTGNDTDIGGNIKAKMGDGDDNFNIDADVDDGSMLIGKNVTVDLGNSDGDDTFDSQAVDTGNSIAIGGGLTVKQKNGDATIDIDGTAITKNLKIDLGAGDDDVHISHHTIDATQSVTVGKSATIKMGDGDDDVNLGESAQPGKIDITKNLTIDLGNATVTDELEAEFELAADDLFHVGGNVSIKGKAGIQDLNLDGFDVDGNAKVNLGDGNDSVAISGIGGDIDSTIDKKLDVKMGNGEDDELLAQRLTVTGKTKIDGGAGASDNAASTGAGLTFGVPPVSVNFEEGDLS